MSISSAVEGAGKAVMKAVGVDPDESKRDLLDTLKSEHDEVKALLKDLKNADTARERTALVESIKEALIPHAKAEEKVLYAAIIALKDKDAQLDGYEGTVEHGLAAETLQKLAGIENATSPEHKAVAKVLQELLEHHISEEESAVWKDAKKHFSDEERVVMNQKYLSAKALVPIS